MAVLSDILEFLESKLDLGIEDYGINGLQVQGPDLVDRIAVGVDGSLELFEKAAELGAGLVIVHHGILWGRDLVPVTGALYGRVRFLIERDMGLFAAHLPLDCHPEWGHNALLLKALDVETVPDPRGRIHWLSPHGLLPRPMGRDELAALIGDRLGAEVRVWPFGPEPIQSLMVSSGGGLGQLDAAVRAGVHAFLTGEPKHSNYHDARESGLNVFFAGHYRTETLGMKALALALAQRFELPVDFIDLPTNL